MKTKAADAEKQATAISEAVERARAEMNVNADAETTEAMAKRHAEELKVLEEKLKTEHEASLKATLEEAQKARPEGSSDIDAAVAEVEKKAEARLQEEISAAVERGRMEQAAKNKLKDSQLVKAQKRVKELEQQIHEWQASGINLPSPSSASAAIPTTPVASSSTATASTAGPPKAPVTATTTSTSQPPLPRKPPLGPGASAMRGGAVPQGPGRGGSMTRGRGGIARGGAPLRQPPVKPVPPAAPTSGGVSIMGAASKRPREEATSSSEDSLAKRMKPAEAVP